VRFRHVAAWAAIAAVVLAIGVAAYASLQSHESEPASPIAGSPHNLPPNVTRGAYLARAADCVACHTAEGGTPFAGGRPFKLPFGTIYSTNLTPDHATGIGSWSEDDFVRAIRQGIGPSGHLYPAMPYTSYTQMSREDVLAIRGYLLTLKPAHGALPPNTLVFPFNQRWGMALWDQFFFADRRFVPDNTKSVEVNRGAYLATALGHCGECHTPRNMGFAMKSRDYLSGANVQGWKAYNTTSERAYGVGAWSDVQLTAYLSQGHAPGRSSASGPMAEVVENSLQYLTSSDISALVAYLRSVSPAAGENAGQIELNPPAARASNAVLPASAASTGSSEFGSRLFAGDCVGCHQWNGVGRQTDYASLVGSHAVNDPSGTALVQVILHGSSITVGGRDQRMPAFGTVYTDTEVAAVANYVLNHFGAKHGEVVADQVRKQRAMQ
jgi:mono/diheme cytochrome c family protein